MNNKWYSLGTIPHVSNLCLSDMGCYLHYWFFPFILQNLTVHIETYTSITSYTTYNVLAYTDDGHEHSTVVVCVAACCSLLNCHGSIPEKCSTEYSSHISMYGPIKVTTAEYQTPLCCSHVGIYAPSSMTEIYLFCVLWGFVHEDNVVTVEGGIIH